jgi:hypothetical protein
LSKPSKVAENFPAIAQQSHSKSCAFQLLSEVEVWPFWPFTAAQVATALGGE